MNIKKQDIVIISILLLLIFILTNDIINNIYESLTNDNVHSNDLPINDISYDNELDLTAPDREIAYNPHNHTYSTHNHTHGNSGRKLPSQHINNADLENIVDQNSVLVDTTGDTPLVYSLDELDTPLNNTHYAPSIHAIDAGSGKIIQHKIYNHKMDTLKSIE
jgi:hypothetical protein